MKFRYANGVPTSTENATANILKAAADPNVISFGGGLPAPELFPVAEMKAATDKVFDKYGRLVLQYAQTLGYPKLREQITDLMKDRHVDAEVENIGVVTGSQQAIDLVARMMINPGDVVIVEDPSYLAAIDVFNSYGAKLVGVPMDEDGMKTDALAETVKKYTKAKFIYTIPNFQNPTGRTMTEERRKELVRVAKEAGIPIVEDDPYGAIRYAGKKLPPLKHFDKDGGVIYLSSFSKILAPGMRLGWLVADKSFMDHFSLMKQNADLHTDNLTQYIVSQFLLDVDLKKHVKKITDAYEHRANLMLELIDKYFPKNVHHSNPEGGMFIWVEIPGGVDTDELFKTCIKNNVAFVPGSAFFAGDIKPGTFRLNFSNMNDEQIKEGIKRMGKAIAEVVDN
ncbi:aminotransferase [Fructilactobacillus lindneri]|uniref:GntR family transcriptional regulator n=2 Tax=Fructilactobacillus lindneri TaxID=53444 RepID=A0A0R2K2R7_9LACO|nr:PLP-dependent aminotransferase family protein [Fructilactobacillus lindneri]ANZ57483.1 aminotransferase [Fructilactobacillus lindneri]ANZ58751.1 aminotransferase [Fructilactobacillus lindneri]KRN80468.1 GntR family transcriptional regulator [Fructilactobacillus lindneri DSM 20690 = JCM 11027]POG97819.1 aminotransferase [Fructilactobacillus lindneri]POG99152.1 aminotransferase [Fructilactobacillus lindneri]